MKNIYFFDLKRELNSVKTIIISLLFILISFLIAKYSPSLSILIDDTGSSPAIEILFGIYAFMGFLFSSILFSGIISKEIESETLRYITPYSSRKKIYLAKYFVTVTYFSLITVLSLIILLFIRGVVIVPIQDYFNMLVFFMYIEAIVLLVSTICSNERMATLINLLLSLIFPIVFAISFFKENIILKALVWLLPYKYLESSWEICILIILTSCILILGIRIFERKEI